MRKNVWGTNSVWSYMDENVIRNHLHKAWSVQVSDKQWFPRVSTKKLSDLYTTPLTLTPCSRGLNCQSARETHGARDIRCTASLGRTRSLWKENLRLRSTKSMWTMLANELDWNFTFNQCAWESIKTFAPVWNGIPFWTISICCLTCDIQVIWNFAFLVMDLCLKSRLLTSEFPRPVNCIYHCPAASRQLPLWVGQSRPLLRNLNLVTEINWHSTAKHVSAWSNADVWTYCKHPSSNWLETLQFPAWRKMTFTCPCHWHKTNRKAITSHLELCLSCHGPLWKAGYWLRNFQGSTHGELNWVDLRHMLNLLKPAMEKMWSNKEPPAFNGLRRVKPLVLVSIAFLIPALQRQDSCLCGSDKAVHFLAISIWWLRLIDIQQQSTSAWSNADVCTCWKHPSSNWLETLQFPAWRKMTFTCPCHWHKTNRKAITGHLELCLSCHGPVAESRVAYTENSLPTGAYAEASRTY